MIIKYQHGKHTYGLEIDGNEIAVYKMGQREYTIDRNGSCDCVGYGYYRKCHHSTAAKELKLLEQLKEVKHQPGIFSPTIQKQRIKIINSYGKKNKWSNKLITFAIKNMAKYVYAGKTINDMILDYQKI